MLKKEAEVVIRGLLASDKSVASEDIEKAIAYLQGSAGRGRGPHARHPLQGRAEVAQDPSPDARLLHPARLLEARLRRRRTRHRRFAGQLPQVHRKAVGKMRGGMRRQFQNPPLAF